MQFASLPVVLPGAVMGGWQIPRRWIVRACCRIPKRRLSGTESDLLDVQQVLSDDS